MRLAGLARAGDDVVGLAARLGEPLAVLLEQLLGLLADALGGLDRLLDRLLALVQRLGDAGNASFASTYSEMPKTSSVQIISPMPGVTRKLPPLSAAKMTGEVTIGS